MLGGAFLCYEGCEKLAHRFLAPAEQAQRHAELVRATADPTVDMVTFERTNTRGAIRTDFILSAEVVVISLGPIASAPFGTRVAALITIASLMTVGVHGLVAGLVKLDDLGVRLSKRTGPARKGSACAVASPPRVSHRAAHRRGSRAAPARYRWVTFQPLRGPLRSGSGWSPP